MSPDFPASARMNLNSTVSRFLMILVLIVSVCFSASNLRAQDSLSVDQAVSRVLKTHPAIEQVLAGTAAAEQRVRTAESAWYPEISAQASYANIGPLVELTIPHMGSFKFYPQDNYDAHISARYTVTDFGRTGAMVDLSRSRAQSFHDAEIMTRMNMAMATVRTFYSILFLRKGIQVQDEQIEALNGHLEAVQKRVQAGTATHFDVLTTQVRVAAAQNQKADMENAVQKQETVLRQLLDISPDSAVILRGDWRMEPTGLNDDSLLQVANRQRIELVLVHDAEETARQQVRLNALGHLPSLKVNLQYGTKNGYIPDLNEMRTNWVASIGAEVPIFSGGRISRQTEEAKALLMTEQAHARDVERQVRTDVEQSVSDVRTALTKIDISQVQLDQAGEAVILARARYQTGSATNLDLLDAESAQSMAKLANLQALYRYIVSRYELNRALGNRFWARNLDPAGR